MVLTLLVFSIVGVLVTFDSNAGTPVASFEAESATLKTVTTQTDSTASGGTYVVFGPEVSTGWLSGAAGKGIDYNTGEFAAWRGRSVPIAGTWVDNNEAMVELWGLKSGFAFDQWTKDLDIAIGAIGWEENWAGAAAGNYDSRWIESLENLKVLWNNKSRGQLYIRFAHEWNGNWYPWGVNGSNLENFKTAWRRFYNLKQSIFPEAKLVFCTNGNTAGFSYDWRQGWPGDNYVDVYATDWYSHHWQDSANYKYDSFGGPYGLEEHRQFAASRGKSFAIAEWGNNSDRGDNPEYITYMYDFFEKNGGNGTGKLLYEIYFNVIWSPNKFGLYPEDISLAPNAAAKYKELW